LTNNPKDLYIEAYDNLITKGYVQLRGVSTCTFQGGDTAILGVNRLNFSSIGGAIENVSSINGQPLSFYSASTISTFADLQASSITTSTILALDANVSSVTGLSSINGTSIESYLNISSISSLNEWALYDALSTINFDNGIPNVLQSQTSTLAIQGLSSINGVPIGEFQNISSISSLNEWSYYSALSSITFSGATPAVVQSGGPGNNIAIVGDNIQLVGAYTDAKNLLLASTISTAVIQGANDNLFGLGLPGLKIEAENLFLSTTQTNITGFINASTLGAYTVRAKDITCSTINTSSITASTIDSLYVNTTAITSLGGYLQISTIAGVDFVNPNNVSFFTPEVYLQFPGRDGIAYGSTISTNQVVSQLESVSSLTCSTINGYRFAPVHSEYNSTIINKGISTVAQVITSTIVTIDFPSYALCQANTSIQNTTGQYHNSYLYLTIDGETSASTITTLINKTNSFSGQSISFRGPALSTGTYSCGLWAYTDTDGALEVSQCDLFTLVNLQ
jgi:hypothetical protein